MTQGELGELAYDLCTHAHDGQLPRRDDWYTWFVMAGRGFGKTRAGSEWVRSIADADPQARVALVAASLGEARAGMVQGESGIIVCSAPDKRPVYEPSLRRISWPNGAMATLYSAAEPEALRGPHHSHACGPGPKRILVNEALSRIAILLNPLVEDMLSVPPTSPVPGACYIVDSEPTGEWAAFPNAISGWIDTQWTFAYPSAGLVVHEQASGASLVYRDGWQRLDAPAIPSGGEVIDS